jgi:hypothetical protein
MSRAQVVYIHISVALTALTGAVFALMKYGMTTDDPFAAANHPLQPHMLSAHVFVAPFVVFAFGWMFGNHIWPKFRFGDPRNRKSGLWSMMLIVPMTLSGYLMQISTNETLLMAMKVAHWATSAVFVIAYAAHLIGKPSREAGELLDEPLQPS